MKTTSFALACVALLSSAFANSNLTKPLTSRHILPTNFKPPQVFQHENVVQTVNLEKSYPRITIGAVVLNVDTQPQNVYYMPFESDLMSRIGGFEVRDKQDASKGPFAVDVAEYDTESSTQFYRITFPSPLAPKSKQTLQITYTVLSALNPLPSTIEQMSQQFVQYTFSPYIPSAYNTLKQKTKVKFPTAQIPDYTILPSPNADGAEDPARQGSTFTYGPYKDVPAGSIEPVSVRYEFTKPLMHASLLERDIEVSHWGGNLATEERYWLGNRAAQLKNHFSRVQWQMSAYSNPPTTALKDMRLPLKVGSMNPYFTDDIGNVSTSRFRSGRQEALLEIKPRYPVFGGWKYSFRIGWDANLKNFLRKLKATDGYVLQVPFMEGPKINEGIEFERLAVRVVLPEGAKNIKFETSAPIVASSIDLHRTFMDTVGRPTLKLTALNVVDEWNSHLLTVTYDYPWSAGYRKPLTITSAVLAVFVAVYLVGTLDVSIGKKKK
ncbi:Ribophorin I [Aulographum hederae CBS 113979]|uniref:Dolichyl-diphosphooligosaccharide--protein glycosyltransferase subunit 1 n=1 Tax=Aulographum hederae CBS 113979 TaxID=1176131 RepID=A0A6G1GTV3_9PEZI|nr:Ribophorin I [Aulographum hederae CBS 113979]